MENEGNVKHELKIWPRFFAAVKDGSKTFEYRKNDRGFQKGDLVVLKEYDPTIAIHIGDYPWPTTESPVGYTGENITFEIGFVLQLEHELCVFSLLEPK